MRRTFHFLGDSATRPAADRVLYCDGGVDEEYREGVDLHLSHWLPNRTPVRYRASTSTEICLLFVAEGGTAEGHDLVCNDHVDVDGVLSAFVLLYPELALQHRTILIQAAEMGDFGGWGDSSAQRLFQALAHTLARLAARQTSGADAYRQGMGVVQDVLEGRGEPLGDGIAALARAVEWIERGEIERTLLGRHFVHYAIPERLARLDLDAALRVTPFNAAMSANVLLSRHARARLDAERIQLVSVAEGDGFYYDLWYPGYSWADTVGLWRPPGICSAGSSNLHHVQYEPLTEAVAALTAAETRPGQWQIARRLSPFETIEGRGFSVVCAFLQEGAPAVSALPPSRVAARFAAAYPG